MKLNIDFITNSSSASFVILKKHLTDVQIQMIHDHIEVGMIIAEDGEYEIYNYPWEITETEDEIKGYTSMDNFDMHWFLDAIGIDHEIIDYAHNG